MRAATGRCGGTERRAEYVHDWKRSQQRAAVCLNSSDGVVSRLGGSVALRGLHLRLLLLLLRRQRLLLLSSSSLLHGLRCIREDVARAVRRCVGVTTTRRYGLLRSLVRIVARVRSLTLLLLLLSATDINDRKHERQTKSVTDTHSMVHPSLSLLCAF